MLGQDRAEAAVLPVLPDLPIHSSVLFVLIVGLFLAALILRAQQLSSDKRTGMTLMTTRDDAASVSTPEPQSGSAAKGEERLRIHWGRTLVALIGLAALLTAAGAGLLYAFGALATPTVALGAAGVLLLSLVTLRTMAVARRRRRRRERIDQAMREAMNPAIDEEKVRRPSVPTTASAPTVRIDRAEEALPTAETQRAVESQSAAETQREISAQPATQQTTDHATASQAPAVAQVQPELALFDIEDQPAGERATGRAASQKSVSQSGETDEDGLPLDLAASFNQSSQSQTAEQVRSSEQVQHSGAASRVTSDAHTSVPRITETGTAEASTTEASTTGSSTTGESATEKWKPREVPAPKYLHAEKAPRSIPEPLFPEEPKKASEGVKLSQDPRAAVRNEASQEEPAGEETALPATGTDGPALNIDEVLKRRRA